MLERKRLTIEDYWTFMRLPENEGRLFELIDGEVVEKMVGSFVPAWIALAVARHIANYLAQNPIGYATGADGGYRMPNGDILIPDAAFISLERMPTLPEREALMPPDLAVEIQSPTDKKRVLRKKAADYLEHGVRMVWLVFPDELTVEVYTADDRLVVLGTGDVLDGGDVLPNFTLPVAEIFPKQM